MTFQRVVEQHAKRVSTCISTHTLSVQTNKAGMPQTSKRTASAVVEADDAAAEHTHKSCRTTTEEVSLDAAELAAARLYLKEPACLGPSFISLMHSVLIVTMSQ